MYVHSKGGDRDKKLLISLSTNESVSFFSSYKKIKGNREGDKKKGDRQERRQRVRVCK